MRIYFLSSNKYKIEEVSSILGSSKIVIESVKMKIDEIQSANIEDIACDKVIKAFEKIGHPVMVEQTGLYLRDFSLLPGGLTQLFWDALEAEKFCKYFGNTETSQIIAKTLIAYCDGKRIHTFLGEINGIVASSPKGDRTFQWDCVFIPEGNSKTFAEMGAYKNEISMRRKALEKFKTFLEGQK